MSLRQTFLIQTITFSKVQAGLVAWTQAGLLEKGMSFLVITASGSDDTSC